MKAEEFIKDTFHTERNQTIVTNGVKLEKLMVKFAKYHVEQALKEASEKATMKTFYPDDCYKNSEESGLQYVSVYEVNCGGEDGSVEIEEDSILNAYPLEKIK